LKRLLVAVIVAANISVFAWRATADSPDALRKTLQSLYDQSCTAIDRKDVLGADSIDTPDYTVVDDKGMSHNLAEQRQHAFQIFRRQEIVKLTVHIDKLTVTATNVIADVTQHLYMKYTNAKSQHVFVTDQTATQRDTWIKQDKKWRRSHGEARSMRVLVNGKLEYSFTKK